MAKSWLETLKSEATARLEGKPYYGMQATQLNRDYRSALEQQVTTPVTGARPQRTDFLAVMQPEGGSVVPGIYRVAEGGGTVGSFRWGGATARTTDTRPMPDYEFDQQAYVDATFSWMRSQERYEDWSDEEIRAFAAQTAGMTDAGRASAELWEDSRIARAKAAEEAEADRNKMLADLETFKDQYNEEWIAATLGREKAYWDNKIQETVKQVTAQYANMGRIASPYMMGELTRRMAAQAADALQVRRFELENERRQHMQYVLEMQNNIFQNTQRDVMDPATAASISQMLGQGDSSVEAA